MQWPVHRGSATVVCVRIALACMVFFATARGRVYRVCVAEKRVEGAYDLKALSWALWERRQGSAATERL
jgi:hypothetical protein